MIVLYLLSNLASGAIEAEAAMLGHANHLSVTAVVGCRIDGTLSPFALSTDIVLLVTKVSTKQIIFCLLQCYFV